jgi:hypothetical protein
MNRKQETKYYYLKAGDIRREGDEQAMVFIVGCTVWLPIEKQFWGKPWPEKSFYYQARRPFDNVIPIPVNLPFDGKPILCLQRPLRTALISTDDEVNLKIALETCETMEDFLRIT